VKADELTCRELVELVTEYLEGLLSAAQRARLDAHLDECDACRLYLSQYRQTIALVGRLREQDISDEALAALRAAFRARVDL
jgi:anti-sigma factor RsiW